MASTIRVFNDDDTLGKREIADMQKERAQGEQALHVEDLKNILAGSERKKILRERMALLLERDFLINDVFDKYDQTRPEQLHLVWRKLKRLREIYFDLLQDEEEREQLMDLIERLDRSLAMRWFVQYSLFVNNIFSQGNEEQRKKWFLPAQKMQMIGGFAMTELGHSSFLRGIETIAEYDPATQHFVINSTRVTATKIWIGGTGTVATHTILFATLMSKGKNCGIQLFMVPLRKAETGEMYPGITVGELGPKAGRGGLDNGFIQFSSVRVPLDHMLMRWSKLTSDGTFTPPPTPALVYGGTVTERVFSVLGTIFATESALTVATRYSVLRRQGPGDEQIIDYQTQKLRLLPSICTSYVVKFTGFRMVEIYNDLMKHLKESDEAYYLKNLPELHSLSCGMKAFATWWGVEALERCRRALGGLGFHAYSSIPGLIGEYGVMTTGGGDNVVIAQQCASFLIKQYQYFITGKLEKMASSTQYFKQVQADDNYSAISKKEDMLEPERLLRLLRHLVFKQLSDVAMKMSEMSGSKNFRAIWNQHLSSLVEVSLLHCCQYALESSLLASSQTSSTSSSSSKVPTQQLLRQVTAVFGLEQIEERLGRFLQFSLLTPDQAGWSKELLISECDKLRPYSISLTDAWNLPDFILNSPLGRYDGNLYVNFVDSIRTTYKKNFPDYVDPVWKAEIAPLVTPAKL